jgi:hypothetical protein
MKPAQRLLVAHLSSTIMYKWHDVPYEAPLRVAGGAHPDGQASAKSDRSYHFHHADNMRLSDDAFTLLRSSFTAYTRA